jgi:transmembrane 9 superfamily member 2/4
VHCLYNHIRIVVKYNEDAERFPGSRIVGFEVVPFSVKHQWDSGKGEAFNADSTVLETCNDARPVKYEPEGFQTVEEAGEVIYTYDVEWKESDVTWAHRWDVYFT